MCGQTMASNAAMMTIIITMALRKGKLMDVYDDDDDDDDDDDEMHFLVWSISLPVYSYTLCPMSVV